MKQERTVARTNEPVFTASFKMLPAITANIPVDSKIPPNVSAHSIRDTVHIIPCIPPRLSRSSIRTTPVSETKPSFDADNIAPKSAPWNSTANTQPKITPPISPGIAGTLNTTIAITRIGGRRSKMLILNDDASVVRIS